jgi:hypothetical protein
MKLVPGLTALALSAVWLLMTVKGQTPPPALSQAIVGALGAIAAGGVITKKADPDAAH